MRASGSLQLAVGRAHGHRHALCWAQRNSRIANRSEFITHILKGPPAPRYRARLGAGGVPRHRTSSRARASRTASGRLLAALWLGCHCHSHLHLHCRRSHQTSPPASPLLLLQLLLLHRRCSCPSAIVSMIVVSPAGPTSMMMMMFVAKATDCPHPSLRPPPCPHALGTLTRSHTPCRCTPLGRPPPH